MLGGMAESNETPTLDELDRAPEKGKTGDLVPRFVSLTSTAKEWEAVQNEVNPDLMFPDSVAYYDRMWRTSSQVRSTMKAVTLPIIRAGWRLDPNGASDEVLANLRPELGIPAPGETIARRRRAGIEFRRHITEAVTTSLRYGFAPFFQKYTVGDPLPGQTGLDRVAHLQKLSPRPPRTIERIASAEDGGLLGVVQTSNDPAATAEVFLPVRDLVLYVTDKEGADWYGQSILRGAVKDFAYAEKLELIRAQVYERNGMGVPAIPYDPRVVGDEERALRAAEDWGAGSTSGFAHPNTVQPPTLIGVSGSLPDLTPAIQDHRQQIAKSVLAMFLDLGHDAGARSLGESFLDVFTLALQTYAEQLAETFTEHVIRDWVDINYGQDEPYPILVPGNLSENRGVTADALATLVNAGVITADPSLEKYIRSNLGLPEADEAETDTTEQRKTEAEIRRTNVDAATIAFRGGFEADSLSAAFDLPPGLTHSGLVPITVKDPAVAEAEVVKAQATVEGSDTLREDTNPGGVSSDTGATLSYMDRAEALLSSILEDKGITLPTPHTPQN